MGTARNTLCGLLWRQASALSGMCCLGFWLQQGLLPTLLSAAHMQNYTTKQFSKATEPLTMPSLIVNISCGGQWVAYDWVLLVWHRGIATHLKGKCSKLPHLLLFHMAMISSPVRLEVRAKSRSVYCTTALRLGKVSLVYQHMFRSV